MSTKLKDRPGRTYTTGMVTRTLRHVAVVGVLALVAYVAATYGSLPETVPTHFDFRGEADDWGHKSSLWVLVGIAVVTVAGMAWLSTRPRYFNYPAELTEHNAQLVYREGERMIVWLNLALTGVFYGVVLSIYGVDSPMLVLGLISMVALTLTGIIRTAIAAGRKPESEQLTDSTGDWTNWLK